jgi:hypothetical protein
MDWHALISGEALDLEHFERNFPGPTVMVGRGERGYFFTAVAFGGMTDAGVVRQHAEEILRAMNGASRIIYRAHNEIKLAALERVRADGKHDTYVFAEPAVARADALPAQIELDGQPVDSSDPGLEGWVAAAQADEPVRRALRVLALPATWSSLYHAFEIIEGDCGAAIVDHGWATRAHLTNFNRTANSFVAAGDTARHGMPKGDPPADPMTLAEAEKLIHHLTARWLSTKSKSA